MNNVLNLPAEILPIVQNAITCEYATLTPKGQPLTYPMIPFVGERGTLDVSTGLTYPAKAERARQNPKVALLYSDAYGSGLTNPPIVLVQGEAAVRDSNLQANTDRYAKLSLARFPQAYGTSPKFLLRQMQWYFARIWIEVTPRKIMWWANGNLNHAPQTWHAPTDQIYPASDPAPTGAPAPAWKEPPTEWQSGAAYALKKLGAPILTITDESGYPAPQRVSVAALTAQGFTLTLPVTAPNQINQRACLTFHTHSEVMQLQENMAFTGNVTIEGNAAHFTVTKRLGDFSLGKSQLELIWILLTNGQRLKPRLQAEATRRNQSIPKVNV